ncbi:MAG: hypothetical protein ACON4U_00760 [Myxococcota bacterium]
MSKSKLRFKPERIREISNEDHVSSVQSNELLLNLVAGLRGKLANEALRQQPRHWSYDLMNQMMNAYSNSLPSMTAPESPVSEAEQVSPDVSGPATDGSTAESSPVNEVTPSVEAPALPSTQDVQSTPSSQVTPNVNTVAVDTQDVTGPEQSTPEVSGPDSPAVETPTPSGGAQGVTGSNGAPEITAVWTRSTMPMFDETADIYFNASDPDWDPLSWNFNISGAHTETGVENGPTPWIKVSVNIPETGMVAGDTFSVGATVRDPSGASDTDQIDLEVDGVQMTTWEVFFDNEDAQTSTRVDLVGDRLRAEEAARQAARRASDPLIFDLDMDGLLGTATGESLSNGQIDGETVQFDIDPERSSWEFVSSTDMPGLDAPAIPNGYVVYDNGDTENIGGNGRWDPQTSNGNWTHQRAQLYSSGNDFIAEWVAINDNEYDYFWGNRMDVEITEWLQKGTGDGFLVWDHNGNGVIDDNTEMMSEYDTEGNYVFENGYEKLRHYFDKDGDGIIRGSELDGLMFWVDSNADAQTDSGELVPLSDYGITQIDIPELGELASEATVGAVNNHISSEQAEFENS